ncbi:MAG: hypothetical protein NW205_05820 [Hyphomicrobiaceae bacterium]|nr:hypothetical protein [Hyphomicrobiaceae bacterium]
MPTLGLDGPIAWLITSLPLVLLLAAMFAIVKARWRSEATGGAATYDPDPQPPAERAWPAAPPQAARPSARSGPPPVPQTAAPVPPPAAATDARSRAPGEPAAPANLHDAIRQAEEARDPMRIARLLLERALAALAASDLAAAGRDLRRATLIAAEHGYRDIHARCRLELAGLAEADGDLITACEHWHMARDLYREERATALADDIESRMRRNGCPTDWVLTQF